MGFGKRTLVPVVIAAFAAMAAASACGGERATPTPATTSTPGLVATATATPPSPISTATPLTERVGCDSEHPFNVTYSVGGKEVWKNLVGVGIEDYSSRVTDGRLRLSADNFQCIDAFVLEGKEKSFSQVLAFGQDSNGYFPSKISIIAAKSGREVKQLWHPGHIKNVVPVPGRNLLVVAALSNIGELMGNEPYVPVIFVADMSNMEVLTYYVVESRGQVSDLRIRTAADMRVGTALINQTHEPVVDFRYDRDPPGVTRTVSLLDLLPPSRIYDGGRAARFQSLFRK